MFRTSCWRASRLRPRLRPGSTRRPAVVPLEDRILLTALPVLAGSTPFIISGVGAEAATALAQFESAIGGADNGSGGPQTSGFRTINWDGVKLDGTDFGGQSEVIVPNATVGIPVTRFQSRGVIFEEVYAVSGDGFASANPGVAGQFPAFSPKNTFAMFNETSIDLHFVLPSDPSVTPTPQRQFVRGFGAIFLDVETYGSSSIEYKDGNRTLGKFFVPPGTSGQPEFLGVLFDQPIVTDVSLVPGTATVFQFQNGSITPGPADITNDTAKGQDLAVTDDFVYAEPANGFSPVLVGRDGLEQVYIDLLHRGVDPVAEQLFGILKQNGASLGDFAGVIESSPEYKYNLIQSLYGKVLRRMADPDGLVAQLQFLDETNAQRVEAELFGSAEYFNTRGGSQTSSFLDAAYHDILNRGVDPAGVQAWGQRLSEGATLGQVAFGILRSPEGATAQLNTLDQEFLGRPAGPADISSFVPGLTDGLTLEEVIVAIIGSQEYIAFHFLRGSA
jgi:hypothetical protein